MDYIGMSVNERIAVSGQAADFDTAVKEHDIEKVILILRSLNLEPEAVIPILNELGFTE
ncbi:MAG TPA: hypothetical protein VGB50_06565 [Flavobacterium sp.]|jgi:hypothetical protein